MQEEPEPSRHSRAAAAVKRRKMSDSAALFQSAESMRLRKPVISTGVKNSSVITLIPVEEFGTLRIDDTYQRAKIGQKVNQLVSVLLSGGQVPEAIHVAERTDGTRWIVDGQQRFWAHQQVGRPIKAQIHHVDTYDAEVRLFVVLNSKQNLTPKNIIKGWPGPSGVFVRRMNDSDQSPLRNMIDMGNDSKKPIDASALARCLVTLTTGTVARGDTATGILPRLDTALRIPGGIAWAEAYVQLLAAVFGPSTGRATRRVRVLPMLALASVAHRKYIAAGRPVFPHSCSRMRSVNWDTQVPTHAQQYMPLLEKKIESLWK